MIIEIKAIKKKENEWKPQSSVQQYFSFNDLKSIINDEKLKENMTCIQNVNFDSQTQTFSNVVITCENYSGEFIYLIKSKNIIKNREYFFSYISQKSWNTASKIVLDLTIDPLSSNLDLFNDNKFMGEVYIERTNNFLRCVNDTHSDVCTGIVNQTANLNKIDFLHMSRELDIFVEKISPNVLEKKIYFPFLPPHGSIKFNPKGTLISNSKDRLGLIGTKTFQNIKTFLPNFDALPAKTVVSLLKKYAKDNVNFDDEYWVFANTDQVKDFLTEVINFYPIYKKNTETHLNLNKSLSVLDTQIFQDNTARWITIPKIFDYISSNFIADFQLDIKRGIKDYNLNNHLHLHYNYFLILNRIFKIPINIIKNKGIIYGIREITTEGVKFSFFNDVEKTDLFFEQIFSLQNALLSDDYAKFEKELLISQNAGMRGNQTSFFGENIINQLLNVSSTFLLGTLASGGNPALGLATALGTGAVGAIGSTINIPFNYWKENKQVKYERMKIQNSFKTPRMETSLDSLYKMFTQKNFVLTWAMITAPYEVEVDLPLQEGKTWTDKGYCIFYEDEIKLLNHDGNWSLLIEQPLPCDIDKISLDQAQYGNIVNEFKINDADYQNPLVFNEHTSNFLFWQGKINPKVNPIDNFQLDFLNEVLARGVKIIDRAK